MNSSVLTVTICPGALRSVSQQHFIKVHFKYGSKPKHEFRDTESKWFGGIHGGHVVIEMKNYVSGIVPGSDFHVFGRKKNPASIFTR